MDSESERVCGHLTKCVFYLGYKRFTLLCLINIVVFTAMIWSYFADGAINFRSVSITEPNLFSAKRVTHLLNMRLKTNNSSITGPVKLPTRSSSNLHSIPTAFLPAMSTKDRQALQDIVLKCKYLLEQSNVSYFLYFGTLLGSYRHHDIIPWDDDVDIILNISDKSIVSNILSTLRPSFYLEKNVRWKFYSNYSRPIEDVDWSWPFLDISFFEENSTHIWDADPEDSETFIYKKGDVFPLTRRPFMGLLFPAPKNTTNVILQTFNPRRCKSIEYSHEFENDVDDSTEVECDLLNTRYPLVRRKWLSNGVNETLEFQGEVVSWFYLPNN
ncbi:uncharacterized protein LOC126831592 [Patella vulgata]|uniref:uncharacterized protein LOC126831592 n=1 Tax=Patella vulgata TaxID=6465 RepID=UPI00217FD024|nr:uncharacterized protein LOC126831592 [Patella vulgata]